MQIGSSANRDKDFADVTGGEFCGGWLPFMRWSDDFQTI